MGVQKQYYLSIYQSKIFEFFSLQCSGFKITCWTMIALWLSLSGGSFNYSEQRLSSQIMYTGLAENCFGV